ncbi:hypothetical protein V1514DRAFT_332738 [Lipomyces japonicus]|uniref:uncharacterized protein n=1 Tax=Lipomyces japonicus TaxID=56871 RepID=UPI0034CE915B
MKPVLASRSYSPVLIKTCLLLSGYLPQIYSHPLFPGNRGRRGLLPRDDDDDDDDDDDEYDIHGAKFWVFMSISITLVLLGGVFAGLTLGLMGQDEVYLQVIEQSGNPDERMNASKVLRLLKKGKHWVLVTMLLSNVITNETLPIVLDRCLGGGWPAVVSSTVLIVIFGEVIPQSVSVRYGLAIGATFSPFVLFLMYAMYPVAYPIALLLDHVLGEDHGTVYRKAQLKTLVSLHHSMGAERLNRDEVTIISAVLDLNEKPVGNIMTPIHDVYTMSADRILDEAAVEEILKAGYSRIPIHTPGEPFNFIGMLLVRILISYDPEDAQPVSTFPLATLPETKPDTTCLNVLNYFQEGKSHMMLVSSHPGEVYGALGVVTLEDVIEELIGEEIVDESDVYVDISQGIKRKYVSPLTRRMLPAQFVAQHAGTNGPVIDSSVAASSSSALLSKSHQSLAIPTITATGPGMPASALVVAASAAGASSSTVLKMEPLNLASRPNETTNTRVTIKRGAMEDYVRRTSMDYRNGLSSAPLVTTSASSDASSDAAAAAAAIKIKKYGPPQEGTGFGTIHDSEHAALLDGPPKNEDNGSATNKLYSSDGKTGLGFRSSTRPRRRSSIELDALAKKQVLFDGQEPHVDIPKFVLTRTSSNGPESATSSTKLLTDHEYDLESEGEEFHASGIIESVRQVHGFQKTIIESTPMSDNESSDDAGHHNRNESSFDSESESSDRSLASSSKSARQSDLERGPDNLAHDMPRKKNNRRNRNGNSSKNRVNELGSNNTNSSKTRKGSFFSDRSFRGLSWAGSQDNNNNNNYNNNNDNNEN